MSLAPPDHSLPPWQPGPVRGLTSHDHVGFDHCRAQIAGGIDGKAAVLKASAG